MTTDTWLGGSGSWSTAGNWSGGVPTASYAALVMTGDPQITAPISIAALSNAAAVTFSGAGSSAMAGAINNIGVFDFDVAGAGGARLTVGGRLTNTGTFDLGNSATSSPVVMTVAGITNSYTNPRTGITTSGTIVLAGGATAAAAATLKVTGGVAGFGSNFALIGRVTLSGYSKIVFTGGGRITTINRGSALDLIGAHAVIDTDAVNSLLGLSSVTGGLGLSDGANVTTTGPLTLGGEVTIDTNASDAGGSVLVVGGELTNSDVFDIGSGTGNPSALADDVTASGLSNSGTLEFEGGGGSRLQLSGALNNSGTIDIGSGAGTASSSEGAIEVTASSLANTGTLALVGGASAATQATLVMSGVAGFGTASALSGTISLKGYSGIEFARGGITSIQSGGSLSLFDSTSFVEDGATNSNSALGGLATIDGELNLFGGASLTTSGGLSNDGGIILGAATLTIDGALTNDGQIELETSYATLTANSLINNETIEIYRSGLIHNELEIDGAFVNDGVVLLRPSADEVIAGPVSGTNGHFQLSSGGPSSPTTLEFDGGVGSGETIDFLSYDQLILGQATTFAATVDDSSPYPSSVLVEGFGTGTTDSYSAGVLTLTDGTSVAHLHFGHNVGVAVGATSTTISE